MSNFNKDELRMAGDFILKELREEAEDERMQQLDDDIRAFVPERRENLALMAPTQEIGDRIRGGDRDMILEADRYIGELGELKGGVPMPIRRARSKGARPQDEVRTHVQYRNNPVHGEREVVPYMDPTDDSRVLKTYLGRMLTKQIPGGHEYASEHLGENALKLIGLKAKSGANDPHPDPRRAAKGDVAYYRADLQAPIPGNPRFNIDVEATVDEGYGKGVIPAQIYTNLNATSGQQLTDSKLRQMVSERIKDPKINENDVVEAIEGLVKARVLDNNYTRQGKVLKNEMQRSYGETGVRDVNDIFDEILYPGYKNTDYYEMKGYLDRMKGMSDAQRANAVQEIRGANTINLANLELAREFIRRDGMSPRFNVRSNKGNSGDGPLRARAFVDIPYDAMVDGERVVEDLTQSGQGLVKQLLSDEQLKAQTLGAPRSAPIRRIRNRPPF